MDSDDLIPLKYIVIAMIYLNETSTLIVEIKLPFQIYTFVAQNKLIKSFYISGIFRSPR